MPIWPLKRVVQSRLAASRRRRLRLRRPASKEARILPPQRLWWMSRCEVCAAHRRAERVGTMPQRLVELDPLGMFGHVDVFVVTVGVEPVDAVLQEVGPESLDRGRPGFDVFQRVPAVVNWHRASL